MKWIIGLWLIGSLALQDPQQALDTIIGQYASPDGPALVIHVATPDGDWTAATGLADGERPAVAGDRFRIGSMSKTFVAVVALKLAEEGVFDLDDPASDWLPDEVVRRIANADIVTIRQLLAMRSGIDDYLAYSPFWVALEEDPTYEWTAEEALEYAYDLPLLTAPDVMFNYSNTNYLLLQLVLEAAGEAPLHTLIRDYILDPLALDNTYTQVSETLPGGFVDGYGDFDGDGAMENVSGINDGAGLGDGGLISNAADIATFYRALLHDQTLLSAESLAALLDFQPDDEGNGYGLGLSEWQSPDGPVWGHGGGVLGFSSLGLYVTEAETVIVILSADENLWPEDILETLAEALFE